MSINFSVHCPNSIDASGAWSNIFNCVAKKKKISLCKQVKHVLTYLICGTILCANSHAASAQQGNMSTSYLYKDKRECLEKNKVKTGNSDDAINMICDSIAYPEVRTAKDPVDVKIVPKHEETEEDRIMKKANEYYKEHIQEYKSIYERKLAEEKKTEELQIRDKQAIAYFEKDCLEKNYRDMYKWIESGAVQGIRRDAYSAQELINYHCGLMGNSNWSIFHENIWGSSSVIPQKPTPPRFRQILER